MVETAAHLVDHVLPPHPVRQWVLTGPDAQIGAVSFLHRFGSALNAHFHFHGATDLTASDWDELQHTVRHRVLRFFIVAALIRRYGAPISVFIDRHFNRLTIAFGVLIVLGFVVIEFVL